MIKKEDMEMIWKLKSFDELTVTELYESLALRNEVFIVEQDCAYHDLDYKDQKALHLLGITRGKVVAYARLFEAGAYFEDSSSIGRVVVAKVYRAQKLGHHLIQKAIGSIEQKFNEKNITISAQSYLLRFYRLHGFEPVGEEYLEDGIPHIKMKITSDVM